MVVQYSIIHNFFTLVNRFFRFGNIFLHFFNFRAYFNKITPSRLEKEHSAALFCFIFCKAVYSPCCHHILLPSFCHSKQLEGCPVAVTAIRTIIIYAMLIVAMRIMGRRQLGELQPIELVVTLLISDLASVPMQDSAIPLLSGLIPILVLVAAEILLSALMLKSRTFSSLVSGTPLVVIRDGKVDQKVLSKLRLTVEDLSESLRAQNIFDLRDVQTAIAETNGTVTVYPTAAKRPVVLEDLGTPPPIDHGMPLVILADGKPCEWAMKACNINDAWLDGVLRKEGCLREDVMILTANRSKDYYLVRREIPT